ncbi:hypothetical protein [Frankia sp. EAN1pec]|uniref:hypothetical protein n=1 Tax=Parafrankia sp. (strain EAN1pec) TaxID=298653 RepID=UPI0012FCFFB3
MSEDGSANEQSEDNNRTDERFPQLQKILADELKIATVAMLKIMDIISIEYLPWSDHKITILSLRAESILSDLDHLTARISEQPTGGMLPNPNGHPAAST